MTATGGSTELATILPGAVFGPVLSAGSIGSVEIIRRLLRGTPAAVPQLGFWIVDVRDLAELHIRAMTASDAAGERFIASTGFMWMEEIARTLRTRLGARAGKVPTRRVPNFIVRLLLPFQPQLRTIAPLLGLRFDQSSDKARRECAESVLGLRAPGSAASRRPSRS